MIIGVDVDDVVANLVTEWLRLYNVEYSDNVEIDTITTWEIFNHVKCGNKIYDYLKLPTLYENIIPVEGALDGVRLLRESGHRVIFITSCVLGHVDDKWRWLVNHGFLENTPHNNDFIAASDKVLINVDLMIDDKAATVDAFGDRGVLFKRPWNNGVDTWETIIQTFSTLEALNGSRN